MIPKRSQKRQSLHRKKTVHTSLISKFNLRAAIIFTVAHFASVAIYNLLVVNNEFAISKGGFVLHMLQASVYTSILFLNLKLELLIASAITAIFYCLAAINWAFLERGIEVGMQVLFYDAFSSIIMIINLTVIYFLGKDSAIHLFNIVFKHYPFFRRI